MFYVVAGLGLLIVIGLGGAAALLSTRLGEAQRQVVTSRSELEAVQMQLNGARGQIEALQRQIRTVETRSEAIDAQRREIEAQRMDVEAQKRELEVRYEAVQGDATNKTGWLDHEEQELIWLRAELDKRPNVTRKTYKILTLGVKWTGKSSLTLKWANPLIDLGKIEGTKIERYERTVSQVISKNVTTEHVFEVGDWGGEHIVDAQQEMIVDEIHGLLIVVDLGGKDAKAVEPARIQEQLREFQPESLKFFFGPKTVASCKAVVLFINKSDLLSGTPAEVEAQAKSLYSRLISDLMKHQSQVDIRVFVGSASYGHSIHLLFSHFVEKILPRNAYDNQLLQRMKTEVGPPRAQKPPPLPAAPVPESSAAPPPLPPKTKV